MNNNNWSRKLYLTYKPLTNEHKNYSTTLRLRHEKIGPTLGHGTSQNVDTIFLTKFLENSSTLNGRRDEIPSSTHHWIAAVQNSSPDAELQQSGSDLGTTRVARSGENNDICMYWSVAGKLRHWHALFRWQLSVLLYSCTHMATVGVKGHQLNDTALLELRHRCTERAPPNASQWGWYWINIPRIDWRLSWPSLIQCLQLSVDEKRLSVNFTNESVLNKQLYWCHGSWLDLTITGQVMTDDDEVNMSSL